MWKRENTVCAFKFIDEAKKNYHLKTFSHPSLALSEGYIVTHQYHCGACSELKNLAAFLEVKDMTDPSRKCTKKMGLKKIKKCTEEMGLTPLCSEAWAYNSVHTKKRCMMTCVKDYGFFNLIFNKMSNDHTLPDGSLRPCILCDEVKSGAGYKYVVGRSRRTSGVESAIQRTGQELYPIDFQTYYNIFDLEVRR